MTKKKEWVKPEYDALIATNINSSENGFFAGYEMQLEYNDTDGCFCVNDTKGFTNSIGQFDYSSAVDAGCNTDCS